VECTPYGIIGQILNVSIDERVLDADGNVDGEKLSAISYDPMGHGYLKVGGKVGNAFADGRALID
jgi:hypothetical protein